MATLHRLVLWEQTDNRARPPIATTASPPRRRMGGGRPGRGGQGVGAGLGTLSDPHVLMAADGREHVYATDKGGGAIAKSRRAREGIRHARVHPDIGMWGRAGRQHAQGELCFGGRRRGGCRCARSLFGGDTLLLEGLVRSLPRTALRGGLRADHAHGKGEVRGHQEKPGVAPRERRHGL